MTLAMDASSSSTRSFKTVSSHQTESALLRMARFVGVGHESCSAGRRVETARPRYIDDHIGRRHAGALLSTAWEPKVQVESGA